LRTYAAARKEGSHDQHREHFIPQLHDEYSAEDFDVVILGDGTGSTVAAWTLAAEGKRVAVIDRKYIGGSCPNIACLPSKNIIHSAKVASYVRDGKEFGIAVEEFSVDMSGVRNRKREMVSGLNKMYLENYTKTGAELIFGNGRFIGPKTIESQCLTEVHATSAAKTWLLVPELTLRCHPFPDSSRLSLSLISKHSNSTAFLNISSLWAAAM
jgi:Pyridine nucleotide-disulphide oxidoreductase